MARIQEIQRLIADGFSDRQIAQSLGMRRSRVREVRERGDTAGELARRGSAPLPPWALSVHWTAVEDEIRQGHELKRIWEERVGERTSYSNFWKFLNRTCPELLHTTVTLREFEPGGHTEVDFAGDTLPWWDEAERVHNAHVFVGILCFSQRVFARAFEDEKKESWLSGHQRMFAVFGGVSRVIVCDNPTALVTRPHLYDPDLNPEYVALCRHYGTAVVPARVRRPKDKALVENAVGIVSRAFRWRFRAHRFRSLADLNLALETLIGEINARPHSRFGMSRQERFDRFEHPALKALPSVAYEQATWRTCRVHPDSTIAFEHDFYSVPYRFRGREVRVKATLLTLEVFHDEERIAFHPRRRTRRGARVICPDHLPPNAQAFREATPQGLLAQAQRLSPSLSDLVRELFETDALGHLRRVQGLIQKARGLLVREGAARAEPWIAEAIARMRRFDSVRVRTFTRHLEVLASASSPLPDRTPERRSGNPMLRHAPSSSIKGDLP